MEEKNSVMAYPAAPNPEVPEKTMRRKFAAAYKLPVLKSGPALPSFVVVIYHAIPHITRCKEKGSGTMFWKSKALSLSTGNPDSPDKPVGKDSCRCR